MSRIILLPLVACAALLSPAIGSAHYTMFLPQSASVKRGETVTLLYQWGHPFEHVLFDAPAPESVTVWAPDGRKTDLLKTLKPIQVPGADQKKVTAYHFRFTPEQRGDYVFVLRTPPIWMEEDNAFVQDTVKVVLHVQAERGWDTDAGQKWELVPLTCPYGLQAGMVFQVQALTTGKPLPGVRAEVERFNSTPPAELPPDELVTRRMKADPGGVVTCSLTDAGWWCVTAIRDGGHAMIAGKKHPIRERATFWVFVEARTGPEPAKKQ